MVSANTATGGPANLCFRSVDRPLIFRTTPCCVQIDRKPPDMRAFHFNDNFLNSELQATEALINAQRKTDALMRIVDGATSAIISVLRNTTPIVIITKMRETKTTMKTPHHHQRPIPGDQIEISGMPIKTTTHKIVHQHIQSMEIGEIIEMIEAIINMIEMIGATDTIDLKEVIDSIDTIDQIDPIGPTDMNDPSVTIDPRDSIRPEIGHVPAAVQSQTIRRKSIRRIVRNARG